jgi:RNA polymerase sigma-70 factor (ECF subfamily)
MQEFQSFYEDNIDLIYRYVYSKIRNRQEAEDLTSSIFVKAMRGIDLARDAKSTRSWLFQTAHTTIADYWRAFYRGETASLDALLETGWETPDEAANLHTGNQATERVQDILQALPERYRDVLVCRFLLNLSVRETAAKMDMTEANVKITQYRALRFAANLETAPVK